MTASTIQYAIVHPDGRVERPRIHKAFSPLEVAAKFRHSLVFFQLQGTTMPRNMPGLVDNGIMLVHDGDVWHAGHAWPLNEAHADRMRTAALAIDYAPRRAEAVR